MIKAIMSETKVEIADELEKANKTVETNIEEKSRDSKEKENSAQTENKNISNITPDVKRVSILNEFSKEKTASKPVENPIVKHEPKEANKRSQSLKNSPEKVKKEEKLGEVNNVKKKPIRDLRPSSPMLQRFMKPAPKIYKKKQIGKKKFLIHAQTRAGIDSESFRAKKKKQGGKRNFHAYDHVDFEEDSEEEEMSVKFWSKKNLIRSISTNPRGFARMMGNKINMIDQIQRLVQLENKQKKKTNMFRSVDISLKEKKHSSVETRRRENSKESQWDPSREKILQIGTSSSLWEKTNLKKKLHRDKQKKKKRFKHLIYSSVQVEKSDKKENLRTFSKPQNEIDDVIEEKGAFMSHKASMELRQFMRVPSNNEEKSNEKMQSIKISKKKAQNEIKELNKPSSPKKPVLQLYKSNSRLDNADGITVELEEDRTVCLDDMETKLCLFFKKTLVYASKIELLKLKAQRENGEHNIYSLFRQFCDPDTGKLTITSMEFLVEVLQYPMEEYDISGILLFLEKFKEVESDAVLELEYGEFRELFISHKVTTPEIYLFSNWTPDVNKEFILPDSEFYLLRQILMLTTRQIQDITRIINALRAYTADSLFNYISLFNEENDKIEGNLNNFFYNDGEVEEMKESFQVQIDFTSKRVQNQGLERPKSAYIEGEVPSFSNNITTRSFRNPSFAGSPQVEENKVEIKMQIEEKKESKENNEEINYPEDSEREIETRSNYSSLLKPQSILNRHIRYKKVKRIKHMSEFGKRKKKSKKTRKQTSQQNGVLQDQIIHKKVKRETNDEQEEMVKGNMNNTEEVAIMNELIKNEENKAMQVNASYQKSLESQANYIDVSTIRNFLNFHGVMFLEEDLELVMHCLGSAHGIVDREAFKRFFYSPLWD